MPPTNDFMNTFQKEYFTTVISLLKNGHMSVAGAKESARALQTLLPFASYEDMKTKIKMFSDVHKDFAKLYITVLKKIEEQTTQNLLAKMRNYMTTI